MRKTSLGAEQSIDIQEFWEPSKALAYAKSQGYMLLAAEVLEGRSVSLEKFTLTPQPPLPNITRSPQEPLCSGHASSLGEGEDIGIAIVFGNEKTGVLAETLEQVDYIIHIPMQGEKESLNVGQAAAIFMWELKRKCVSV